MRVWAEHATGLASGRRFEGFGHAFIDVTDAPFPAVMAGRPVNIVVEHDMGAYYASDNPNGFLTGKRFNIDNPAPTVMADGMAGDWRHHWHIGDDGKPDQPPKPDDKPPYRVPLMSEIAALPWNGLTVASTFSGAGGSCTGYRMAGYRVAWANEFLPAAQESYRANHPGSVLDDRDIRLVRPEEILEACGLAVGELDLFDGSPPCQAFSTAGKREKGWGEAKQYENGARQCNELLFAEYTRLVRGLMPRVFVAENVSGLVKGVAKGYFKEILRDLKACGYRVTARLLDAQWLGVPQARQRIIFVGVREDLGFDPVHPAPLGYRYTVRDALPWITNLRLGAHGFKPETHHDLTKRPCTAVAATGLGSYDYDVGVRNDVSLSTFHGKRSIDEPAPTILTHGRMKTNNELAIVRAERDDRGAFGNGGDITDIPSPSVLAGSVGTHWISGPRDVIRDTAGDARNEPIADRPCPAITGTGDNAARNATHYLVAGAGKGDTKTGRSPDGIERRKFTIDELKRICAFPDDYVLAGTYAQQWERLGNSVPPVMMFHVAREIAERILLPSKGKP